MASVAEQLRLAREARGLTISQIADITKMRTDHVRALEEGNYDMFMAPVFIRGFMRTYVRLLKMDEAAVMSLLDGELKETKKFCEPPPLMNQQRPVVDVVMLQLSKLNWKVVLPLLVLAVVIVSSVYVYRAVRHYRDTDPTANLGPGVYQPKPGISEVYLSPTNAPRR